MDKWTYVGEIAALRKAAEDVIWAWDVQKTSEDVKAAVDALRKALHADRRYSWTADYYDIDWGNK